MTNAAIDRLTRRIAAAWLGAILAGAAAAQAPVKVDSVQLFAIAERAKASGNFEAAQQALAALTGDRDPQVRNEARYRLGQLLASRGDLTGAAAMFRRVLDDNPGAQPVRIELAAVLAQMGDDNSARRQLRAVNAGRLPPEVARLVDRFATTLRDRRPMGGSIQFAIAPDSNINRSTRSDALGTVIGDFLLTDDAKATSGVGVSAEAQQFARIEAGADTSFLFVASQSARLYRQAQFNDLSIGLRGGPEIRLGADRLNLLAAATKRWFGHDPLLDSLGISASYSHPVGRTAQVRLGASAASINNLRNDLEDGLTMAGSVGGDVALSQTAGAGATVTVARQAARDAGYSTFSGQASAYAYREWRRSTLTVSVTAGRLDADERLLLYPVERRDWSLRGTLGATWRKLSIGGFSPSILAAVERNQSNIEVYDFSRRSIEFGVARAF